MIQRDCTSHRTGFSLIDLLMTVAVLAVVAAVAVPALSDNHRLRVRGAAAIIASDIEFAQTTTIAFPNDPVVIVFDPAARSYHLAFASDPNVPLQRPDTGEDYVIALGSGRANMTAGVTFTLSDMDDNRMGFSPHGGLESFAKTPRITLRHSQDLTLPSLHMEIDPMTGAITESWHEIDVAPSPSPAPLGL